MTIAEELLHEYRNNDICCPNVDGWVVLCCGRGGSSANWPLSTYIYCIKRNDGVTTDASAYGDPPPKWVQGSLSRANPCTVFDSYDEAVAAANEFPYVKDLPPADKRIVKIKIKTTVELQEDRPVDVLDALAEV